jgi:hypothetical protein
MTVFGTIKGEIRGEKTHNHRATSFRSFRVPAVYLRWAFLQVFSSLLFRRISNLRSINPPEGFDSHPGHQFV